MRAGWIGVVAIGVVACGGGAGDDDAGGGGVDGAVAVDAGSDGVDAGSGALDAGADALDAGPIDVPDAGPVCGNGVVDQDLDLLRLGHRPHGAAPRLLHDPRERHAPHRLGGRPHRR